MRVAKIVFLIEELNGGGKERRMVNLIKELAKEEKYKIYLLLSKSGLEFKDLDDIHLSVHRLPNLSKLGLFFYYRKLINKINPDIIHAWSIKTSIYMSIIKPFFKFKFVSGFIGDTFQPNKSTKLFCNFLIFKMADVVVSNSKQGLNSYKVPKKKGVVIYNGIGLKRKEKQMLNNFGVITPINIIMAANVTRYKDYATFVSVAEAITNERDDISFISIGRIWNQYKQMVSPYVNNKHGRIKFLGFQDNPEKIISACDIGVLFSNQEGISNAILEYMKAGLPVVTTDKKGASKELIVHGETGWICENHELKELILKLADDELLRNKIGENGVRHIRVNFSLENMINNYIKLYNELSI